MDREHRRDGDVPLADRRPPDQAADPPSGGEEIAAEDTPSETDPPNQPGSDRPPDEQSEPPTRA